MEKTITKFILAVFILCAAVWLYASAMINYESGLLLKFGTVEFADPIDPVVERAAYHSIAEHSVIAFISYPLTLLAGIGYVLTTRRSFRQDGWLMMSAILFFMFVPVELFCFWRDWKIVGLNYWGDWPLEEFRKALLLRLTALAGLPLIAQICYYTIPIIIIFKPFKLLIPEDAHPEGVSSN